VNLKLSDTEHWLDDDPIKFELFALEMQAIFGSYYSNKDKLE
jgi:hypothetical protein